jgi:hypothetical protein
MHSAKGRSMTSFLYTGGHWGFLPGRRELFPHTSSDSTGGQVLKVLTSDPADHASIINPPPATVGKVKARSRNIDFADSALHNSVKFDSINRKKNADVYPE